MWVYMMCRACTRSLLEALGSVVVLAGVYLALRPGAETTVAAEAAATAEAGTD